MVSKITIRPQHMTDAKRFYEILNNDNFKYFDVRPKSIEDQKIFLRANSEKRKKNIEYNYAILLNGKLIGAVGLKIQQTRKFIGEIGYFVDEEHWGKGIATKAVKLIEKIGFGKLKLKRITIVMLTVNKGSMKVAEKAGYKREGILKKGLSNFGKHKDAYLYAKTK
jgi:[ribosomal protein S5]-alanine N-acetyltransferase